MTVWTLAAALWLAQQPSASPTLTPADPTALTASVRPTLTMGAATGVAWPTFVLDCPNAETRPIPEMEVLTDLALRVDGSVLPAVATVGSVPSTPGVVGMIELRASVRVNVSLVPDFSATIWSGRFGSRFSVTRVVPLTGGRHQLAVRCLGRWSNEVTFEWEP
jgi:hypothetical protein